jgi:toxin HigB-1
VRVGFRTVELQAAASSLKVATMLFGPEVGRRYIQRVEILHAAPSAAALRSYPALHFHALAGQRRGEYAMRLTGFMRLIVTFADKGLTVVCVEEVSKHYGD